MSDKEEWWIYVAEGKSPTESEWHFVDYEASPEASEESHQSLTSTRSKRGDGTYRIREVKCVPVDSEVWYDELEEEELMKQEENLK